MISTQNIRRSSEVSMLVAGKAVIVSVQVIHRSDGVARAKNVRCLIAGRAFNGRRISIDGSLDETAEDHNVVNAGRGRGNATAESIFNAAAGRQVDLRQFSVTIVQEAVYCAVG